MNYKKWHRGFFIQLSENKNIEIEWDTNRNWFYLTAGVNQGDHWGFEFRLSLLTVEVSFIFYDSRHRDDL
jgi:hypothetical protein